MLIPNQKNDPIKNFSDRATEKSRYQLETSAQNLADALDQVGQQLENIDNREKRLAVLKSQIEDLSFISQDKQASIATVKASVAACQRQQKMLVQKFVTQRNIACAQILSACNLIENLQGFPEFSKLKIELPKPLGLGWKLANLEASAQNIDSSALEFYDQLNKVIVDKANQQKLAGPKVYNEIVKELGLEAQANTLALLQTQSKELQLSHRASTKLTAQLVRIAAKIEEYDRDKQIIERNVSFYKEQAKQSANDCKELKDYTCTALRACRQSFDSAIKILQLALQKIETLPLTTEINLYLQNAGKFLIQQTNSLQHSQAALHDAQFFAKQHTLLNNSLDKLQNTFNLSLLRSEPSLGSYVIQLQSNTSIKYDLRLRPIREDEYARLMSMQQQAYRKISIDLPTGHVLSDSSVYESINTGKAFVIVAEAQRKAVGFIFFEAQAEKLVINDLVVSPKYQRSGVGQVLLERLYEILPKLACTSLAVNVNEYNLGAQLFFKALGFKAVIDLQGKSSASKIKNTYFMEKSVKILNSKAA